MQGDPLCWGREDHLLCLHSTLEPRGPWSSEGAVPGILEAPPEKDKYEKGFQRSLKDFRHVVFPDRSRASPLTAIS